MPVPLKVGNNSRVSLGRVHDARSRVNARSYNGSGREVVLPKCAGVRKLQNLLGDNDVSIAARCGFSQLEFSYRYRVQRLQR